MKQRIIIILLQVLLCGLSGYAQSSSTGAKFWPTDVKATFTTLSFAVEGADEAYKLKSVLFDGEELKPVDGRYTIESLEPNMDPVVYLKSVDADGTEFTDLKCLFTLSLRFASTSLQSNKTSAKVLVTIFNMNIEKEDTEAMQNMEYGVYISPFDTSGVHFAGAEARATYEPTYGASMASLNKLLPNTKYTCRLYYKEGDEYQYLTWPTKDISTTYPELYYNASFNWNGMTLTTIDGGHLFDSCCVVKDGEEYNYNGYTISGLRPGSLGQTFSNDRGTFTVRLYQGESYMDIDTGIDMPSIKLYGGISSTPTTVNIAPFFDYKQSNDDDNGVVNYHVVINGVVDKVMEPGEKIFMTGLEPNRTNKYRISANVKIDGTVYNYTQKEYIGIVNRYPTYSDDIGYYVPQLEFTILPTRNVSATSSIVAAETNLSDKEPSVGFQWRKYDAPESLPSSEGQAYIFENRMEGRINNLQSSSYYNVRAFYKSAAGNYTYTDWITFDPSDFSYFEPSVHTYKAENIGDNEAYLRGYVIQGTDEIISQGFEYYPVGAPAKVKSVNAEAQTEPLVALATGQSMAVVIDDLQPGTSYCCRAFATTGSGKTYGEEIEFTTSGTAAINSVTADSEVIITGYYNINGQRFDTPQPGFNIVVYSDGSVRKVMYK